MSIQGLTAQRLSTNCRCHGGNHAGVVTQALVRIGFGLLQLLGYERRSVGVGLVVDSLSITRRLGRHTHIGIVASRNTLVLASQLDCLLQYIALLRGETTLAKSIGLGALVTTRR